jgi:ADP-heptose:LPS heptosyltransferase
MIIIAPWAQQLRNNAQNPKNYPYWEELLSNIDEPIVQIGIEGEKQLVKDFKKNLSLLELKTLVKQCKTWIGVDSFFQHFCWSIGKPGIVLWGQSDPNIFGHKENINLLKSRDYLRADQFLIWEQAEYIEDCFVKPEVVLSYLQKELNK